MKKIKKLSKQSCLHLFSSQKGQISRILIILAVITLLLIVSAFVIFRITQNRNSKLNDSSVSTGPPEPVYETTLGDVRLLFESAQNLGSVLKAPASYQSDLKTTEKFIKVTISAQNKGKNDLKKDSWGIGNIVDSAGRNFIPLSDAYLPQEYQYSCGAVLKPEFEPVPCVNIYEVSKVSTNLRVEVSARGKKALIDLSF